MLVTLKTLEQQTFSVEVDDTQTVNSLKEKIAEHKGKDFAVENQKLIYSGKILDDTKLLSDYKIDPKNFVVIMVTKPKPKVTEPAPAAPPAATAPASPVVPSTPDVPPAQPVVTPQPSSETTHAAATVPPAAAGQSVAVESVLVTGETYERAVTEMLDMGFERAEVERAMRASFNNPTRAIDYLLNGIPEDILPNPNAPSAVHPTGAPGAAPSGSGPTPSSAAPAAGTGLAAHPAGGGADPLAFLATQPQFMQMRQLIQQNPSMLPTILQQIRSTNPALLQIITENQDRFVQMLNDPSLAGEGEGEDDMDEEGGGVGGEVGGYPQERSGYVQITQEEKLAIDRLKALGFPEGLCLQAYFACEKNEDLAANFLLSQDFDDEAGPPS